MVTPWLQVPGQSSKGPGWKFWTWCLGQSLMILAMCPGKTVTLWELGPPTCRAHIWDSNHQVLQWVMGTDGRWGHSCTVGNRSFYSTPWFNTCTTSWKTVSLVSCLWTLQVGTPPVLSKGCSSILRAVLAASGCSTTREHVSGACLHSTPL